MSTEYNAYALLNSTEELRLLAHTWTTQNKSRVYLAGQSKKCSTIHPIVPSTTSIPTSSIPNSSTVPVGANSTVHVLASMRQVMASRKDLVGITSTISPSPVSIQAPIKQPDTTSKELSTTATQYAVEMANTETHILRIVLDRFSTKSPPYSNSVTTPHHQPTNSVVDGQIRQSDIKPQACFACIRSKDIQTDRQVLLPIPAPSSNQISKCKNDASYNKNVMTNIAEALSHKDVNVVLCSGPPQTCKNDTVYIDLELPVKALGNTECCEALLFGENRTTSSPDFCVEHPITRAYAIAVHGFQKYSNIAIGTHITLVPSFRKRTMHVISMTCPELEISTLVTGTSATQHHPKFGSNHTTRIVEVMAALAPFIKTCSEKYLSIPPDMVDELRDDDSIPTPTSTTVEHCFANNAIYGVSAYVGTHTFSLDTRILNTYIGLRKLPIKHDITVHVAAIFGGFCMSRT